VRLDFSTCAGIAITGEYGLIFHCEVLSKCKNLKNWH